MVIGSSAAPGHALLGRSAGRLAVAGAGLAIALVVVMARRSWRWARLGVTAVHESGHAVAALLVGRRVSAIHLRTDSSGVTIHHGPGGRAGRILTAAAGYPAPCLVGLAGAWLLARREPRIWLAALLALGVVNVVLWVRNLFGWVMMAVWVAGLGWLIAEGTTGADAVVSSVGLWYLLLGGLRAALESWRASGPCDAVDIGRLAHIPRVVCQAVFVVVGAAAVVMAGLVLVGPR